MAIQGAPILVTAWKSIGVGRLDPIMPDDAVSDGSWALSPESGRPVLWREFVPRDSAGVVVMDSAIVTPDRRAYSYGWHRSISDLYLVDGLV